MRREVERALIFRDQENGGIKRCSVTQRPIHSDGVLLMSIGLDASLSKCVRGCVQRMLVIT